MTGSALEEERQRAQELQAQYEQMVQANLDHLDPEQRMAVMQEARIKQALDGLEQRILSQVGPQLRELKEESKHKEMMRLGDTYVNFDLQTHAPLIEMFRGKNPNCTIDQAYRAIATGDELVTRASAVAHAVPPVVPPSYGQATPRYMPEPSGQTNMAEEVEQELQEIRRLRSSMDPADQRAGIRLVEKNLARRFDARR